jgi:hypothetical protein
MSKKFDSVPVEEDTIVLRNQETHLGEYAVLHQIWKWDTIIAESIIFLDEEVIDLEDQDLETIVKSSPFYKKGQTTIKRSELGFTFVNFNFESD